MTSLSSPAAPPTAGVGSDPRTLLLVLLLIGVLLLGALVIAVAQRWRRAAPERLSPSDQLARFRLLYEEGQLSREEFDRLRALLGGQIRQEAGAGGDPAKKGKNAAAGPPKRPDTPPATNGPIEPPPPVTPPDDGIRPA